MRRERGGDNFDVVSPRPPVKRYDARYFDRWYRDPRHRVVTRASLARKARMVLGVAEYLLGRPVRTVLDIGCGEAPWRAVLRGGRPRLRYVGVDDSEYVVRRFGARRDIRRGRFGALGGLHLDAPFDLIVCSDVLQYVPRTELERGVREVASLLGGVAFLEAYTNADDMEGDLRGWQRRTSRYYRRLFARAGLVACGMHCYASPRLAANMVALERGWPEGEEQRWTR